MMRAVPGKVGALNVARLDSCHVAVIIVRGVFRAPSSIIPLSDESAPGLNIEIDVRVSDIERCFLIAISRGRKYVHAVIVAGGQIYYFPLRYTLLCNPLPPPTKHE